MEALEISVINRISGFDSGLNRLTNPSLVSRVIDLVSVEEIFLNSSLWTWGALILAVLATFSSLIDRTKLVIFRFWRQQKPVDSEQFLRPLIHDYEDDNRSSSSSDDEDELPSSLFENQRPFDVDFRVAGCCSYDEDEGQRLKIRRRFSWSDFASGKSVVKLWEELGLGLKIEGPSTEDVVSMWDLNKDEIISSFHGGGWCQIPATLSPVVRMDAVEESGKVALRVWDSRVGLQIPAVFAELGPRQRRIVGVDSDGVEKVYVTDDSGSVTLRDMRKIGLAMESDGENWWEADAVIM